MKSPGTRRYAASAIAAALLLLLGCQSTGLAPDPGDEVVAFDIPYQYEFFGAGNEGVLFPTVPLEKETEFFSIALIKALQDMEYSVVKPSLSAEPWLPEGAPIETDAVRIPASIIDDHNRSSVLPPISLNAYYRLSYEIVFGVNKMTSLQQKSFWLHVRSRLERRGAAGQWHAYRQPYSSKFFASLLHRNIEVKLKSIG